MNKTGARIALAIRSRTGVTGTAEGHDGFTPWPLVQDGEAAEGRHDWPSRWVVCVTGRREKSYQLAELGLTMNREDSRCVADASRIRRSSS
jgi:hypothetical protein